MRAVEFKGKKVVLIDQTKLPDRLKTLECLTVEDVARAIEGMKIRGAPAVGIAGAMGLAIAALGSKGKTKREILKDLKRAAARLRRTRPTGADLFTRLERVVGVAERAKGSAEEVRRAVVMEVKCIVREVDETDRTLGTIGAKLIRDNDTVLTHCNAGWLATGGGYGTALAAVRMAKEEGKRVRVIATETRPLLQGARLTAWELKRDGINVTVITDNMVGYCLSNRMVDLVMVGADRILKDGHVINKIGTYTIAVAAKRHRIPFYVVAPLSTFDPKSEVREVKIEERDRREIEEIFGKRVLPRGVKTLNPAFDITPPDLVTAIVTERGIVYPPFRKKIPEILRTP